MTHVSPKVCHTFEFPFYHRLWTVKERRHRLVTFETFDQSDEETRPDPKKDNDKDKYRDKDNDKDKYI